MTKEEAQEATMHAEFEVLGVKVLCSDSFGRADKINNGISLLIDYDVNNKEDADKELPFADQFWGGKMGIFTDKYGVRWMLHGTILQSNNND